MVRRGVFLVFAGSGGSGGPWGQDPERYRSSGKAVAPTSLLFPSLLFASLLFVSLLCLQQRFLLRPRGLLLLASCPSPLLGRLYTNELLMIS